MKKRYYVYAHYNSKGELFYVGKGCNGRDEDLNQRSKEWLAEAKDGPRKQSKRELRDGKKAKEKMVTANLRLVVAVAKK